MSLKCGIVGLPNVGKSTLFNCLSNAKAQSANFPFCTIEPNVGVISVPDDRLTRLVDMCAPKSVVPATVEIVDIAGLVKGASKGEGLGNKFLANIRETDAILHVLRCFDDDNITHVDTTIDPVRDMEVINYELQIKDLETVESRMAKTEKAAKAGADKTAKMQLGVLAAYREALEQGRPARSVRIEGKEEQKFARELFLLTNKPVLYVCNVDDSAAVDGNAYVEAVREAIRDEGAQLMIVAASSYLTIIVFEPHSIYSMRLAKKGELLTHHKDKAVLTLMKVENVVEKDFVVVHPEMDLGELVKAISTSRRNIFPVTDKSGILIGIVTLDDIRNIMFRQELYHRFTVGKLMTAIPARLYDTDSMEQVMRTFDDTKAWNLPVVDEEGHYLGFVSKSKIFNSYRQVLVHFSED